MPRTQKAKVRVRAVEPAAEQITISFEVLTMEQRKKQAEEPLYLNRL